MTSKSVAMLGLLVLTASGRSMAEAADDNPMHLTPHHAVLSVADLGKETKWYREVLGFREGTHLTRPGGYELRSMEIPGYRFDLVVQKGSTRPPDAPRYTYQGYSHVVLQTPVLEETYQRMLAHGVKVQPEMDKAGKLNHMTIWDAEGNEIEIFLPANPGVTQPAKSAANPLQFAPHHAAVTVADIPTEQAWYEKALGFRASSHFANGDLAGQFMDIPGYRLMLESKTGSSRPPARPPYMQQGYVHVVYATPTLEADYQRLQSLGIKVDAVRDPKSHALTRMTINDPEGNEIELLADK